MSNSFLQETGKLSSEQRELLALLLEEEGVSVASSISPRPDTSYSTPLSFSQQRLWFLHQIAPDSPAYNIPLSVSISGPLNLSALHQALSEILRRHQVLRSHFSSLDFSPVQFLSHSSSLPVPLVDLSSLDSDSRLALSIALSFAEARRPFDLDSGPVLRSSLLIDSNLDFSLLFTLHHIVSDGWSMALLVKEVASLYIAFSSGLPSPLPELHIQFADFAYWQRLSINHDFLQSQLDYWKLHLNAAPPLLNLPTDRPRPPVLSLNGSAFFFSLPPSLSDSLRSLARQSGVTLFILLLAAFKAFLSRLSNQFDISVGSPISGRNRSELEPLIGFFVNTLVLRSDLSGDPSFSVLLARVRKVVLDAYANQDVPFEMLIDLVSPERNLSHSPLFQVMFILQNTPHASVSIPSLTLATHPLSAGTAKFDITLGISDTPGSLIGSIEFNTDLFDHSSIERFVSLFRSMLQAIVADPLIPLSRIQLLSPSDLNHLLLDFNDSYEQFDLDSPLHLLFEAQVDRSPLDTALIFDDTYLSFFDLNQRANRLAHFLIFNGVSPDSIVAVCCHRSIDMVVALLAVLKAGAAYLPLDPSYPADRLRFLIDDSSPRFLLSQHHLLDSLPPLAVPLFCLDSDWSSLDSFSSDNPTCRVSPDNLAYMIYTSGSTGSPKGALISHRSICNRLLWMQKQYCLTPLDTVLQKTPFSFDVSVWEFFWPLITGSRLLIARPDGHKDPSYLLELISRHQVTTIHFVPSMLQLFLQQQDLERASSLRQVFSSGEALPAQLQRKFFKRLSCDLHNLYGPTEAAVDVTYWRCDPDDEREAVPIGRPISNTRIYILDQSMQAVPIGVTGEVHIAGWGLARGYHRRGELTAEKFIPDCVSGEAGARLYKSGDIGKYLEDGSIQYVGRMDDQVKIRGMRIEPGEIEAVMEGSPFVEKAVVMAREYEGGERRLEAYVEMKRAEEEEKAEGERIGVRELREYVKGRVPDYMVPVSITVMERMPITANGKVDRKALPLPDRAGTVLEKQYLEPRTPVQKLLAEIWSQVLGVERIGINDNFFEIGGDSILSMQVIARANSTGLGFTPKQVFQHQTIAELAEAANLAPVVEAEQGHVTGIVPLTPIQRWFFEQNFVANHHWNQANLFAVPQMLNVPILENVLAQLLNHHDALRLRLYRDASGWIQLNAEPDQESPFAVVELSSVEESERPSVIERLAAQAQERLDLSKGPLLRILLFDMGAGQPARLLIVIHHLVIDVISWRILLDDLKAGYQQLSEGKELRFPSKTTSYKQWAESLAQLAQSQDITHQADYWLSLPWPLLSPLRLDFSDLPNTVRSSQTFSISLDSALTQALLREVPKVYNTQINDALLAALAMAFAGWSGQRSVLVDMEGHGRHDLFEDLDVSRTVGWFTTIYPVLLSLGENVDPGSILKSVKEQLRQLPGQGIGFGLLRYLCQSEEISERLRAVPQAEVSFLYLGQTDQAQSGARPDLSLESGGSTQSPEGNRPHLLQINGTVSGGELRMSWTYSENLHRRETIEELAQSFMEALRSIITHCLSPGAGGYTPSDLPEADLSQGELDAVLAYLSESDD